MARADERDRLWRRSRQQRTESSDHARLVPELVRSQNAGAARSAAGLAAPEQPTPKEWRI
jgi:hypothetical protein